MGQLDVCENQAGTHGTEGKLTCDNKFIVALSVQNQQVGGGHVCAVCVCAVCVCVCV